jgi:single-stranded-DNA-specific exonuclease
LNKVWRLHKPEPTLTANFARQLQISPLTAQVLLNRGVKSIAEADAFLHPKLAQLRDPLDIPDIVQATKRVLLARERGEKVVVFGDYDVDGVTGTTILLHALRFIGLDATYYIPHRYEEGYSLSVDAVTKLAQAGAKLIVTVDCGSSSFEEVAAANALGLEVIVTDHHNLPQNLPAAFAVVNPKRISGDHPSKDLAGAGVAFKFAWALLRAAGIKESQFLVSLLDLASLGTISDVVPLTNENRVLAAAGLTKMNEGKRLGLKSLAESASIKDGISVHQIYFGLAPRINAAGRLEHASKSVELLLTEDPVLARELAAELNRINVRRQEIGSTIKLEIFARLTEEYISQHKVVLLTGRDWHPGVIGIVASQVVDRFARPAILIGINDGIGRGSARSLEGFNVFALLESCRDLFIDFGGHKGAAGFEIKTEKLPELESRLQAEAERTIDPAALKPVVVLDAEIDPAEISLGLIGELAVLGPHGEGNPLPTFMSRGLKLSEKKRVGKEGRHLKLKISDGRQELEVIGFDLGEVAKDLSFDNKYDLAYRLETNEWNGFENVQLRLLDIRENTI